MHNLMQNGIWNKVLMGPWLVVFFFFFAVFFLSFSRHDQNGQKLEKNWWSLFCCLFFFSILQPLFWWGLFKFFNFSREKKIQSRQLHFLLLFLSAFLKGKVESTTIFLPCCHGVGFVRVRLFFVLAAAHTENSTVNSSLPPHSLTRSRSLKGT